MEKSITLTAPFLRSSLPPDTRMLHPSISLRVNKTSFDNQYDLYSRTFTDGSSMIELVDFTVSYAPVDGIFSLRIIISVASEEIFFLKLDFSNAFQNIILPYTK